MSWIICAVLTVALMAMSIRLYFNKEKGVSRILFVLGCLFAATYIIYIPVFQTEHGILPGLIGNFVHVLRVVTIDADVTQYYPTVIAQLNNEVFSQAYIILMGILHICLPTVSALTAVTVLLRCFSSFQLLLANHRKKTMFVFSEVNARSLHLAKSLEQLKCDIVFAGSAPDAISSEIKSNRSYICKEEGIHELSVRARKGKNVYFFCISDDEDVSLSQSLQLMQKYATCGESEQEHIYIYHFAKHRDFSVFIDSADKGVLNVRCVNEYEMLIYNLLEQYPLTQSGSKKMHVLLHGFSSLNAVALRAIAWCGQLSGYSLRISVVGVNIAHKAKDFEVAFPGLFTHRYDIRFYNCENDKELEDTISRECSDANYIIVSDESDNAAMERGIQLRRLFYRLDPKFAACPPIFCYVKEPSKYQLISKLATAESNPSRKMNYNLVPFGSLDEVFTYENLVDSPLEKFAKNVHLAYEEIFSDGPIDVKQALKRYNIFEVNKRSNRAAALHIRYKLNMLGLDYTDREDAQAVELKAYYTDQALEKMSISEHDRWMAFLETEGWLPSTREDVLAYRDSGISKGRHNCPILKMHPYICEYEKLKDLSMELEGKDTTIYDTELIVRIPDILADKWNVSGKKYKITKLN